MERKIVDQLHQQYHAKRRLKRIFKKAFELSLTVIIIGGFIWLIK